MEALEAILSRRSIRSYTDEAIPEEKIELMLRAAMAAPSANNHQPWEFVVITKREIIDAIPGFHPYSKMLLQAPLAILVCGDKTKVDHSGYLALDCSAATENLLLAAHALGIGAVWLGVYPRDDRMEGMIKLLRLPEHIVPLALISLGYPQKDKEPSNRFDPVKIHYDKWGTGKG
ncbi:MAG: nitroreductase family protein [Candidatus Zixiibacteriota bacterium]